MVRIHPSLAIPPDWFLVFRCNHNTYNTSHRRDIFPFISPWFLCCFACSLHFRPAQGGWNWIWYFIFPLIWILALIILKLLISFSRSSRLMKGIMSKCVPARRRQKTMMARNAPTLLFWYPNFITFKSYPVSLFLTSSAPFFSKNLPNLQLNCYLKSLGVSVPLKWLHPYVHVHFITDSGQQLRQDDPSALKDIIEIVQGKISTTDDAVRFDQSFFFRDIPQASLPQSSRTRFMIETLTNLKNNKLKKNASLNQGAAAVERMKKFLTGLSKTKHSV